MIHIPCDSGSTEDSSLQADPGPLLMDSPKANLSVEIQDFPPQSSLGPGQKVRLFHCSVALHIGYYYTFTHIILQTILQIVLNYRIIVMF